MRYLKVIDYSDPDKNGDVKEFHIFVNEKFIRGTGYDEACDTWRVWLDIPLSSMDYTPKNVHGYWYDCAAGFVEDPFEARVD